VRTSIAIGLVLFPTAAFPASLPSFDIKAACAIFHRDEESETSDLYRDCLENEATARDQLSQTISSLSDEKMKACADSISKEGSPSYLALLGCIGASKKPAIAADGEPSAIAPQASESSPPSSGPGPGKVGGVGPPAPGMAKPAPSMVAAPKETPSHSLTGPAFQFTHDLGIGVVDPDVKELQRFLNAHDAQVAPDGPGSPGKEAEVFGPSTQAALIRFQDAHASEVLTPAGITKATGFFGATTRNYVNKLGAPTNAKSP